MVFVIVTDGEENSSREFTRDQIRTMVEHQQSAYKWQFTFLAANQDAFAAGGSMGIAHTVLPRLHRQKTRGTYAAANAKVARMRKASAASEEINNAFSSMELNAMMDDEDKS